MTGQFVSSGGGRHRSGSPRRLLPVGVAALLVSVLVGTGAWAVLEGWTGAVSPTGSSRSGAEPPRCSGIEIAPGVDIQEVLDSHPEGTTFCLAAGVHRIVKPLKPDAGDALVGRPGAVLNGAQVLDGWRRQDGFWVAPALLPTNPGHNGECLPAVPTCRLNHDVFLDGVRMQPVEKLAALRSGGVLIDYRTNSVTIAEDPRGRMVEQAVAPALVRATVDDVTVENLVLEKAANEAQTGAVENRQLEPYRTGEGWRIVDNEVRLNHGVGLGVGDGAVVTGNLVHHQGQLGLGVWGAGATIRDNEIAFNGTAGYDWHWEAGGAKLWMTREVAVTDNRVHHNRGPGVWGDGGNLDTTYARNRITGNWGAGIQHEISYDARIVHNKISGNGTRHKGWAWEAGIQIQSSGGIRLIEVAHNVVTDNANGITLLESGDRRDELPAPHGPHAVANVWVHHNTVTMGTGQATGAVSDVEEPSVFLSGNRFFANTYVLESLGGPHFLWGGEDLTWYQWRDLAQGFDAEGSAELLR